MRAGGGKSKGTSFERTICKALSLWISDNRRTDLLWRSAISGGRATVDQKKGRSNLTQLGDICAVHPDGHILTDDFFIETKHYADLNLPGFLIKQTGVLQQFWDKLIEQSSTVERFPMLIFKQNNFPEVVALDKAGLPRLGLVESDASVHAIPNNSYLISLEELLKIASCKEIWRGVKGWSSYEVSDKGRIRHKIINGGSGYTKTQLEKGMIYSKALGRAARLAEANKEEHVALGKLILEAFVGPAPDQIHNLVLHKDDCEWNNTLKNLYWGSKSDNQKDAIKNHRYNPNVMWEARRGMIISSEQKAAISAAQKERWKKIRATKKTSRVRRSR